MPVTTRLLTPEEISKALSLLKQDLKINDTGIYAVVPSLEAINWIENNPVKAKELGLNLIYLDDTNVAYHQVNTKQ